jgi:hypothetical protein
MKDRGQAGPLTPFALTNFLATFRPLLVKVYIVTFRGHDARRPFRSSSGRQYEIRYQDGLGAWWPDLIPLHKSTAQAQKMKEGAARSMRRRESTNKSLSWGAVSESSRRHVSQSVNLFYYLPIVKRHISGQFSPTPKYSSGR